MVKKVHLVKKRKKEKHIFCCLRDGC